MEYHKFRQLVIDSGKTFGIIITGGGTSVIADLLQYGGMSKVFIGAEVPYSYDLLKASCRHYTSKDVLKAVSQETADLMAVTTIYKYRCDYVISCTSSLYSEGQRDGRLNHAYVSVAERTPGKTWYSEIVLKNHLTFDLDDEKTRSRPYQEAAVSVFIQSNIEFYLTNKVENFYIPPWEIVDNSQFKKAIHATHQPYMSNK